MANELVLGALWLQATLQASTALTAGAPGGVWSDIAPNGVAGIWTRYSLQSPGVDQYAVTSSVRLFTAPLYLVVVEGQVNDYAALQAGADAIDVALHDVQGTQNGRSIASQRETPFQHAELRGSAQWRRLGGLYRLYIQ